MRRIDEQFTLGDAFACVAGTRDDHIKTSQIAARQSGPRQFCAIVPPVCRRWSLPAKYRAILALTKNDVDATIVAVLWIAQIAQRYWCLNVYPRAVIVDAYRPVIDCVEPPNLCRCYWR